MKSLITVIIVILLGLGIWSYAKKSNAPVTPTPVIGEAAADGAYTVDPTASSLTWEGSKILIPGYTDMGTLTVSSGQLSMEAGMVSSGSFVIDMSSLSANSTGSGTGESNLTTHLKSGDFFDVVAYPTASFTITGSAQGADGLINVSGDLKIKDKTNSITIPAAVIDQEGQARITGSVELDRTLWNITYGSGKFFQDLGDNVISDTFKVTLDVIATPVVAATTTATSTTN